MEYVRGAIGAFFIFAGLAVQGIGLAMQVIAWLVHQAGWIIETAGSRLAEW